MNYPPDYHIHTWMCRHATGKPVEYAAQAVKMGLTEIGFSDHSPMARDDFDNWRMRLDQLDSYVGEVQEARRCYPQLVIRLALEIDYIPGFEDWIRDLSARQPWDYLIGSVHYVTDTWDVDNPAKKAQWRDHDPLEVWTMYFERLARAAASGLFDIIGHPDLPKKFGYYPSTAYTHLFGPFLEAARKHSVAIDVNTAGLRKECQEIYPSQALLKLAREQGLPIAFGSDAHAPEEVGANFKEALELARHAGYTHYCRFEHRHRRLEPMPQD
jgi:histidinol-phosphatase (PHP family)